MEEAGQRPVFCRRKHLNLPICAVCSSTERSKAGMKFEGTQYTSGEALGGQSLFQTLMCIQGVLILAVCRSLYWAIKFIFITAVGF